MADGDSIDDVKKHCLDEFRLHWQCLDENNQQMWECRLKERRLNRCVYNSLVRITSPCRATNNGVLL